MEINEIDISIIHPSQSRFQRHRRTARTKEEIQEMANSIRLQGVIQPIVVRPLDEQPGHFEIIAGEGRWTGSKKAAKKTIPAIIRTDIDDAAALQLQIVENLQRTDLDHITEAVGYSELLHLGYTIKKIAAECSVSASLVQQKVSLNNLSPDEQKHLTTGNISCETAYELSRIPEDARSHHLNTLIENRKIWNQSQAVSYIKQARHRDKEKATWTARENELTALFHGAQWRDFEESEKVFTFGSEFPKFDSAFRLAKMPLDSRFISEYQLPPKTTWGKLADQLQAPKYILRNGRGEPVLCVENILLDKLASIRDSKNAPRKHPDDLVSDHLISRFQLTPGIKWGELALQTGAIENLTQPINEKNVIDILQYTPATPPLESTHSHHAPPRQITQIEINSLVDSIPSSRLDFDFIQTAFFDLIAPEFHDPNIQTAEDIARAILKIRASVYIKSNQPENLNQYHTSLSEL